jgi:hypothetical protein
MVVAAAIIGTEAVGMVALTVAVIGTETRIGGGITHLGTMTTVTNKIRPTW